MRKSVDKLRRLRASEVIWRVGQHARRLFPDPWHRHLRARQQLPAIDARCRIEPLLDTSCLNDVLEAGEACIDEARSVLRRQTRILGPEDLTIGGPLLADLEVDREAARVLLPAHVRRAASLLRTVEGPYRLIEWQRDHRSGHRWSARTWYRDIKYGHIKGVDVKVPWELGRLQHLPRLAAAAAQLSRSSPMEADELWRETANQLLDFMAFNPPGFGVQWACAMDAAIRCANMILAYEIARIAGGRPVCAIEQQLAHSLTEHRQHIAAALEWHPTQRNNHYLADLAGILWVSRAVKCRPDDRLQRWAVREFCDEITAQFSPEGSGREGSTGYHRLSAEIALSTWLILQPDLLSPSRRDAVEQRLRAAARFSESLSFARGEVPPIGDEDNGRFLSFEAFSGWPTRSHTCVVRLAAALAQPNRIAALISALADVGPTVGQGAADFPQFGVFVRRYGPYECLLRVASAERRLEACHRHNDQLSVVIAVGGHTIVTDPGTYAYSSDPAKKLAYVQRRHHSTVIDVHGLPLPERGVEWGRKENAKAAFVERRDTEIEAREVGPISVSRVIRVCADGVHITDRCDGGVGLKSCFVLAPTVRVLTRGEIRDREIVLAVGSLKIRLVSSTALEVLTGACAIGFGYEVPTSIVLAATGATSEMKHHILLEA